jgi:hypothetical protein
VVTTIVCDAVDGHRPLTLQAGDFVLLPATPRFTMSSPDAARFEWLDRT